MNIKKLRGVGRASPGQRQPMPVDTSKSSPFLTHLATALNHLLTHVPDAEL